MLLKRTLDIVVALMAVVLFMPLMIGVALVVRLRLGSPVLFVQTRAGRDGRPFQLVKFRTMLDAIDAQGQPLPDAQRLTPLGARLRASSLDELPQIWNVLRGDMSLIGPRPLMMNYLPLYSAHQSRRHEVRPGITGWAQINGRNAISWQQRLDMDVWYVDNRCFWLDLRIFLRTFQRVWQRQGVAAQGEVTMAAFQGNPPADEKQAIRPVGDEEVLTEPREPTASAIPGMSNLKVLR